MKFKVGDKVIITKCMEGNTPIKISDIDPRIVKHMKNKTILTIDKININDRFCYIISIPGIYYSIEFCDKELQYAKTNWRKRLQ